MEGNERPDNDQPPRVAIPVSPVPEVEPEPDGAADHEAVEFMAHTSPDGRPPELPQRSQSGLLFGVVATLVAAGVIVLLVVGGFATLGVAIAFLVVLFGAAFPVWVAAILRARERRRADDTARVITRWWDRPSARGGLRHR